MGKNRGDEAIILAVILLCPSCTRLGTPPKKLGLLLAVESKTPPCSFRPIPWVVVVLVEKFYFDLSASKRKGSRAEVVPFPFTSPLKRE